MKAKGTHEGCIEQIERLYAERLYTGKDIAMQLLIDHGVKSLGHRKISLSNEYSKIGVSVNTHSQWGICAVIDFN